MWSSCLVEKVGSYVTQMIDSRFPDYLCDATGCPSGITATTF